MNLSVQLNYPVLKNNWSTFSKTMLCFSVRQVKCYVEDYNIISNKTKLLQKLHNYLLLQLFNLEVFSVLVSNLPTCSNISSLLLACQYLIIIMQNNQTPQISSFLKN